MEAINVDSTQLRHFAVAIRFGYNLKNIPSLNVCNPIMLYTEDTPCPMLVPNANPAKP